MNSDAISLQKEKILYETQRTPMKAKAWVVGAAQGSIGLIWSMLIVAWIAVQRFARNGQLSWLRVKFVWLGQAEAWG